MGAELGLCFALCCCQLWLSSLLTSHVERVWELETAKNILLLPASGALSFPLSASGYHSAKLLALDIFWPSSPLLSLSHPATGFLDITPCLLQLGWELIHSAVLRCEPHFPLCFCTSS